MVSVTIRFDYHAPTAECPHDTVEIRVSNRVAEQLRRAQSLVPDSPRHPRKITFEFRE